MTVSVLAAAPVDEPATGPDEPAAFIEAAEAAVLTDAQHTAVTALRRATAAILESAAK